MMGSNISGLEEEETVPLTDITNRNKPAEPTSEIQSESSDSNTYGVKQIYAYICLIIGRLGVCCGLALAQVLNRTIPHSELNGLRYSFQFAAALIIVCAKRVNIRVPKSQLPWICLGSVLVVTGSITSYGEAYYLPLGSANSVVVTLVLLITFTITLIIHRTIAKIHLLAVIICFIGMLFILQPTLIFVHTMPSLLINNATFQTPCGMSGDRTGLHITIKDLANISDTSTHHQQQSDKQYNVIGYILVVLEAVANTSHIHLIKYRLYDLDTYVYMFWSSLFGVVISFCMMGSFETPAMPVLTICIIVLASHIVVSGSHNFFILYAYKGLPTTVSALITTLQIPTMFLLQYTALSGMYPGKANALEVAGAVLVLIGSTVVPAQELLFKMIRMYKTKAGINHNYSMFHKFIMIAIN